MDQTPDRSDDTPTWDDTPPWNVVAVTDPDGTGADFGYTVGLARLGQPELHMWARPTDGNDPGHDFKLSPQDICLGLNHYAGMLLEGKLPVGSEHPVDFDGGLTHATFRVGGPVAPSDVDAFQADPDSTVLPMRWELHREPEGTAEPVSEAVTAEITDVADEWLAIGIRHGNLDTFDGPEPGAEDAYGPWSPAIRAARSAVWATAARGDLSWCIDVLADQRSHLGHWMAAGAAIARRHGRSREFSAAAERGRDDGQLVIDGHDSIFDDMGPAEVESLLPVAREATAGILQALYALLSVRDLLDEPARSTVFEVVMSICDESSDGGFASAGAA